MTIFPLHSKLFLLAMLSLCLCACQPQVGIAAAVERSYQVVETLPHPQRPFTQGLVIDEGEMIESSGLYGQSYVMSYSLGAPEVPLWQFPIGREYFAEGLTVFDNKIYLLSWKRQTLKIYDRHTRQRLDTLNYEGEGWGLTHNGEHLIRSDGSHRLFFHDPDTFAVLRTLPVREGRRKITDINELEYAEGLVWANIWKENRIVAISPETGKVIYTVSLESLAEQEGHTDPNWVLNGIAWDEERQGYWITGKRWRNLYLLALD